MTTSSDRGRRRFIVAAALAFIAAIVMAWHGLGDDPASHAADAEAAPAASAAAVAVVAVGRGRIDVDGGLIQIAAQRDGVIAQVFVGEGEEVRAGQLLARQDDRAPRAALGEAQAALTESRAALTVLEVRLKTARRERERFAGLAQAGAESRKLFDEAQSRLDESLADVARQRGAIALAEARVQTAQVELRQREIHAPVDGRIVRRQARPGIGASTLNVSTLFTLVPAEQYVVRVDLEESFVGKVAVGQRAQIVLEASGGAPIAATVLRIGEIFGQRKIDPTDTQTRVDERVVEVVVSLPDRRYRIGQRALVKFLPLDA